ncbi:bacillithiol system redox-active protein YtxJ [Flavobacterium soyangense]|uniref:Bacillithiol system redox-active protein YtxJ n=1 Tax=Flavobacterium soyangense TaxID=2023265 RepID=A0A930Y1P1_9FLAO|nr:bacillithiol system redox-active protein YtxJ [Flavobacterium soyangense]MBF2709684.1 bacillithiol system redox-active protein YtxJ [Flavobacterium soyangense]
MSVFSNIFGGSEKQDNSNSKINWIPLNHLEQLDEIVAVSSEKPVVIFKHSTRCIISSMALKQFEKEYDLEDKVDAYFLDLLGYRAISNDIASRFGVYHQSPQLLLIKDGKAIYDVSHESIDAGELKAKL